MAEPITPNIGKVYFLKSGLQRDHSNLDSFHPASTGDINKIHIFLEDGVSSNLVEMNYKRVGSGFPPSEQFPMRYVKAISHMVSGENFYRTFAMYEGFIPSPVSMWNANGRAPMSLEATITQLSGESLLGNYEDYSSLINAPEAQELEGLYTSGVVAYIYESSTYNSVAYNDGFYMVFDNGNDYFTWERIEIPITHIEGVSQKQYNVTGITLQKGNIPTTLQRISLSQEYISFIMRYLASVQKIGNDAQLDIDDHKLDVDNPHLTTAIKTPYVNIVSGLVSQNVQGAIDELDSILDEHMDDLDNPHQTTATKVPYINSFSGLIDTTVQGAVDELKDISDNHIGNKNNPHEVKATQIEYEVGQTVKQKIDLKADITYVDSQDNLKADITYVDSENQQQKTYIDNADNLKADKTALAVTNQNVVDLQNNKVPKTTTIIGLDLQDNILIGEFRTFLGNATQSVAGLLSPEDKTHLDGLVTLLETSDGNTIVNTIGEILEIFENYPEGANILEVLNDKVVKIEGKGLSENDYTDIDKNKVNLSYTHSEIVDGSNPHNTKFINVADKPTTRDGYGITDVYTKPETYTQLEINNLLDNLSAVKGLKSTLLTPTELSNGDTISTNLLTNNGAYIVFTATDTSTGEIDSDTVPVSTITTGKKFVFFDNQEIVFTIGETNSTFETSEDITLKINLLYLDSENIQAISVDFDGSLTNYLLSQTNVQEAIEKLDEELKTTNDNSSNHTNNTNNPHSVTKAQVGLSNVDNTSDLDKPISTAQQTALDNKVNVTRKIADIDLQDDITKQELKVALDVDDIETANMIKSITRSGSNLFTITYYDDTTSSLLTLAELKSFIGEATTSLSGLMSAQDKTDLDTLMALFDEDGDSVVNTIQEILDVFQNYPEGVDLVTALAGKQDKLVAGENITIDENTNVISASGGMTSVAWQDVENKPELYNKSEIDLMLGDIETLLGGI